jgi:tRNA threonylcarbamoyladenosine biosynthesis protein TsaB
MILLVTDTSGKNGTVALARANDPSNSNDLQVIEEVPLTGGTFSAELVPRIAALLAKQELTKANLDAFVVVSGPGSFTGLRVGLAAIKALAEVLQKPIVSLSLLEVIALASHVEGNVVAALDAGRGELYAGEYEIVADSAQVQRAKLQRERLLSKDEFFAVARDKAVSTPEANLAEIVRNAGLPVFLVPRPTAEMIAELGWTKWQAGDTVSPDQLEANYIRRTDAEIFAKPASH